jgi:fructokinase
MSDSTAITETDDEATEPITQAAPVDASERRALVIGEALIDVVRSGSETLGRHPGGSPMNVAIGLARLGRGVDLLSWFGDDADGAEITAHLAASGVAVVPGSASAAHTSVATATLDADGAASYDFDLSWEVPTTWASPTAAPLLVHTGSIAAVLEPGGRDVARILEAHRPTATITYDPNMRPSLMAPPAQTRPLVDHLVGLSDVVKVSDEDLAWLEPGSDPTEVARRWVGLGPAAVIVTRGGDGAVAVTSSGLTVTVATPRVTVADTVGAGDSFMGGLIDGLWSAGLLGGERRDALHTADAGVWTQVLERCARIAAVTVSRPGANPPTSAELDG